MEKSNSFEKVNNENIEFLNKDIYRLVRNRAYKDIIDEVSLYVTSEIKEYSYKDQLIESIRIAGLNLAELHKHPIEIKVDSRFHNDFKSFVNNTAQELYSFFILRGTGKICAALQIQERYTKDEFKYLLNTLTKAIIAIPDEKLKDKIIFSVSFEE